VTSCGRCGAGLALDAPVCPYCKTTTAYGHQLAERQRAEAWHQQQYQAAAVESERRNAQVAVDAKGRQSLVWSLIGLTGCFPASIVGVVIALRAKSLAKERGLIAPGSATSGLVLGLIVPLALGGFLTLGMVLNQGMDERKAELRKLADRSASTSTLDQKTACTLAELRLLEDGYGGVAAISIDDFDCPGKVTESGEHASLSGVRFRPGSKPAVTVTACFNRGARWSVEKFVETGDCETRATDAGLGTDAGPDANAGPATDAGR
jgi:hypothetical protein